MKALKITGKVVLYIVLWILLVVSLLPLVQWWAGLLALLGLGILYGIKYWWKLKLKEVSFQQSPWKTVFRLLVITVFFGVFAHLTCAAYSSIRMSEFTDDAHKEVKKVFDSLSQEKNK
ncbi:MAG: hypothetical protein D6767_05915 [Candidatus Hydrogenedentota bacterium]|nr:MAG: hypothetical protein D6767_05915 [Candidatus Hydrogenedentota bacterium]